MVFQLRPDDQGVGGSPRLRARPKQREGAWGGARATRSEGDETRGTGRGRPGMALLVQVEILNFVFSCPLCHLSLTPAQKEGGQLPISQTENRGLE